MVESPSDSTLGEAPPIISASGIVKRFGSTTALDGLDLSVQKHEVHGLLGPNGAGKSTAIRALLGQLRLNAGALSVFGLDPWREAVAVHRRLAYVPGDVALWPGLTGGECIDLLGSLQGQQNRQLRDELIERFDLDPTSGRLGLVLSARFTRTRWWLCAQAVLAAQMLAVLVAGGPQLVAGPVTPGAHRPGPHR